MDSCLRRFVLLVSLPSASVGISQEQPTGKEVQEAFAKAARDYKIVKEGSEQPLDLHKIPVLKWGNAERLNEQGVVFVWLDEGLPLAIGSFFTYEYQGLRAKHELHSLAQARLSTTFRDQLAWTPNQPGVTWHRLTDVREPSKSKGVRLTQMKQIAGSFEVELLNPDGDRRKLRLLRTPLFRFASPEKRVTDGAILSYAVGTDPEALLIVRAKGDVWEYAFARCHYWELQAKRNDKLVWKVALELGMERNKLGQKTEMSKVYNSFHPEQDNLFRP